MSDWGFYNYNHAHHQRERQRQVAIANRKAAEQGLIPGSVLYAVAVASIMRKKFGR